MEFRKIKFQKLKYGKIILKSKFENRISENQISKIGSLEKLNFKNWSFGN